MNSGNTTTNSTSTTTTLTASSASVAVCACVTQTIDGSKVIGNIVVGNTCLNCADTTSTAAIYLYKNSAGTASKLTGTVNTADTRKTVTLALDAASSWVVTGNSYLTTLTDADSTYSNITCKIAGCVVRHGSSTLYPETN